MSNQSAIAAVRRLGGPEPRNDQDLVAVEAPLTVTVSHPGAATRTLGVLMRTPGYDHDLVLGMLYAEGVVRTMADVVSVESRATADAPDETVDAVHVALASTVEIGALPAERPLLTTSACGLCGRLSVQGLDRRGRLPDTPSFPATMLASLPGQLRSGQAVFAETGGLHAAALFDAAGTRIALAEDVGRHNAVDKVVGTLFRAGRLPATGAVLVVSGRVAFEIVQKAVMAGAAALVAVGAPSSLAIDAARASGLTLVGFARDGGFNIYTGSERVR